jgi:hypothetical protein
VVEVWRDITERRRHEGRMMGSQRLASLGTLASGFSHEMNTPLGSLHVLDQALIVADGPDIDVEHLPAEMRQPGPDRTATLAVEATPKRAQPVPQAARVRARLSVTAAQAGAKRQPRRRRTWPRRRSMSARSSPPRLTTA